MPEWRIQKAKGMRLLRCLVGDIFPSVLVLDVKPSGCHHCHRSTNANGSTKMRATSNIIPAAVALIPKTSVPRGWLRRRVGSSSDLYNVIIIWKNTFFRWFAEPSQIVSCTGKLIFEGPSMTGSSRHFLKICVFMLMVVLIIFLKGNLFDFCCKTAWENPLSLKFYPMDEY